MRDQFADDIEKSTSASENGTSSISGSKRKKTDTR
jgi:hypothetical protein